MRLRIAGFRVRSDTQGFRNFVVENGTEISDLLLDRIWEEYLPIPSFMPTHRIVSVSGRLRRLFDQFDYEESDPIPVLQIGAYELIEVDGSLWSTDLDYGRLRYDRHPPEDLVLPINESAIVGDFDFHRRERTIVNALKVKPSEIHRHAKLAVLSRVPPGQLEPNWSLRTD
jgi:hypothetical protein